MPINQNNEKNETKCNCMKCAALLITLSKMQVLRRFLAFNKNQLEIKNRYDSMKVTFSSEVSFVDLDADIGSRWMEG